MHRFVVAGCMIFGVVACASVQQSAGLLGTAIAPVVEPAESDLAHFLVDRPGITERQAIGGAGSIFALAQQRMAPEDFMQLTNSVPDMDRYLASVPQATTRFKWGIAAHDMDGNRSGLAGLSGVSGSFQALDMHPELAFQFVSAILQYLQQRSELAAMSLLQNALY